MGSRRKATLVLWIVLEAARTVAGEESSARGGWTRFRGPNGTGIAGGTASELAQVPVRVSERHVRWKTELPGTGHSSPVVLGSRVFFTAADETNALRRVGCVDLETGGILWTREYESSPYKEHHRDNSYASASPAADETGVYVTWTTPDAVVLLGLRLDGKEKWKLDLGPFQSKFGSGTSPIVFEDLVVLANDQMGRSFLIAVDRETGKTRWKVDRRSGPNAYATPCLWSPAAGSPEIIFLSTAHGVTGVEARTGRVAWEVTGIAELPDRERPVVSPVLVPGTRTGRSATEDRIVGAYGVFGGGSQVFVVTPGSPAGEHPADSASSSEGIRAEVVQRIESALPYVPTPLVKGDLLFLVADPGQVACHRMPSGELLWRERLPASFYASPVCVGDRLYLVSKTGEVFVLSAGETFEVMARSELGEPSFATPAVASGSLIFRTFRHLIRVGGAPAQPLPESQRLSPGGDPGDALVPE